MPGLVRGMARTAVVAGTATAVSNRVSRRQAARWNSQTAAPPSYPPPSYPPVSYPPPAPPMAGYPPTPTAPPVAPPAPAEGDDLSAQLQRIAVLHDQGILSDAEFAAAKAKLLGA